MGVTIVNVRKEHYPPMRFIGKRYTEKDRKDGSFGGKWDEWFGKNLFAPLEQYMDFPANDDGYMAIMRIHHGEFEYWIGMFCPPDSEVPKGYDSVEIGELDFACFWLYGPENSGDLYGMDAHNLCLKELAARGWTRREDDWCFERYNCPRFTSPDKEGCVILDYGLSLE